MSLKPPVAGTPGVSTTAFTESGVGFYPVTGTPGGVDDTALVQAAITSAGSSGEIVLPAGTWALALGTLGSTSTGTSYKIRGAGPDKTIIAPVDATTPIFNVTGPGNASSDYFELDNLAVCLPADRAYDAPLITILFQKGMIRITPRVKFYSGLATDTNNGTSYTGTFLKLDGSYEGAIEAEWRSRKYAVPMEFVNSTTNAGLGVPPNLDTLKISGTINGCVGHIFRDAYADVHGLHFDRYKITSTVFYSVPPYGEATIATSAVAGDSSLILTTAMVSGTMAAIGDVISIGKGDTFEVAKVTGVSVSGTTTLTLSKPLRFAHASGAANPSVITGGRVLSLGKKINAVQFDAFHFEGFHVGVSADDGRGFLFASGMSNCAELIRLEGETRAVTILPAVTSWGTPNAHILVRKAPYNAAAAGLFGDHVVYPINDPNPLPGWFITPTALFNTGNDYHEIKRNRTAGTGAMSYIANSNVGVADRHTPAFQAQVAGTMKAEIDHNGRAIFQAVDFVDVGNTSGLTAAQIDTLVNTLLTGSGSPGTSPLVAGLTLIDHTNKRFLTRVGTSWYPTAMGAAIT